MRRIILFYIMSVGLILSLSTALAQDKVVVIPLFDDCTGSATSADVLSGKTFSNASGKGLTGTRPPAPVPKTGQTNSDNAGDDGSLQKGVSWPTPRFTDNGDGTVTDDLTGLIWLKNANCFGNTCWWYAISDCASLASGSCGLTDGSVAGDWHLPNIKELLSLIHYGFYFPGLPNTAGTGQWTEGDPFTGVQSALYWSCSRYGDLGPPLCVDMSNGFVDYYLFDGSYCVWPVRGGNL